MTVNSKKSVTFLKSIFMMMVLSVGQARSLCRIFTSITKEFMKNTVSKLLYLVFFWIKQICLLNLKRLINIIEETQNIILKAYDFFARTALNSKEYDLLMKNIETTKSIMKSSETSTNHKYSDLDDDIENLEHFRLPDIVISNLKSNTSIIFKLKLKGMEPDEQKEFYPTFSNNCNESDISISSSLNYYQNIETDLHTEFQMSENQISPATKDSKLSILPETKSVNKNDYFSLRDKFGIKDKFSASSILRRSDLTENYFLSKNESIYNYYDPSIISTTAKHDVSFDGNATENKFPNCNYLTMEEDIEMSKYDIFKENLRTNLDKNSIELLRRHKLISDSTTEDSSDESNCNYPINEMNLETNEVKNENF